MNMNFGEHAGENAKEVPRGGRLKYFLLFLSALGFIDSLYLTIYHYKNLKVPCGLTQGCDVVLQSSYASLYNTPIALFGALYYAVIFGLVLLTLWKKAWNEYILQFVYLILVGGVLMTLWLLYVQAGILRAYCQYCLVSALTTAGLFVSIHWLYNPFPSQLKK